MVLKLFLSIQEEPELRVVTAFILPQRTADLPAAVSGGQSLFLATARRPGATQKAMEKFRNL